MNASHFYVFPSFKEHKNMRIICQGVASKDIVVQRNIEIMYQGQWQSLAVSAPSEVTDIDAIIDAFHYVQPQPLVDYLVWSAIKTGKTRLTLRLQSLVLFF